MEPKVLQRLELFVENTRAMKAGFFWHNTMLKRLAALLYAAQDKALDPEKLRECTALLRASAGFFSPFRGNGTMMYAALLALNGDPAALLQRARNAYEQLKQAKFQASDYLVAAAFQIAVSAPEEEYGEIVLRARAFYDGMKRRHRFLTGQDDCIFSAQLGMSDLGVEAGLERMEQLFQVLRPAFHSGNGVHALTQVLVLGGAGAGIEARVLLLRGTLREWGLKLDYAATLSALGILALLPLDVDTVAKQITDVSDWLREQKGFGPWSINRQERRLLSATFTALNGMDPAERSVLDAAFSTSMLNIVIAQQVAVAAASAGAVT